MARSRSNKRQARALNTLQEKAYGVCVMGIGMLVLPAFLGGSPLFTGLRQIGFLLMVAGIAMLCLHRVAKSKQEAETLDSSTAPRAPAAGERKAPRVVREASDAAKREPASAAPKVAQRATAWSTAVFAAIEWRRFEAVCEKLFAQAGFETKSQSHGADGGVDIWLHSRNAAGPVAVVQCKHWQGKPVGVKEMREFFGVMASHQLKRGTYATTSTYTADAQQFAKDNGINALDGNGLLALIAKRTPEQQQELLDVAYEGEYWRPTCASCGVKLMERKPSNGGAKFWGCSNYPKCKSRLPMVAALQ